MKKTLLTFMALLAIAGSGMAQSNALSVADIELSQNSEAALVVSFQLDAADTYTGYSFNLELPEELEFVMDEGTDVAVTKGSCHDATHSVTANLDEGLVKVAGLSLSSKPLVGTSGVLLTFTIKPKTAVTVGQSFTGTIKDILIVPIEGAKKNLSESTFNITIGEPVETRTVLDETSTTAPTAATGVDVRVKRAISANKWSTICLPFAMTETQVKAAFGDDVLLKDFTGYDIVENGEDIIGITISFAPVTAMEANHPYLIKVTNAITYSDGFTVDGVDIAPEDEPVVSYGFTTGKGSKAVYHPADLIGTYKADTTVPENDLFISNNKFYYSAGATKMKAFRAYFEFDDVLTSIDDAGARITMVDSETTGITEYRATVSNDTYYDLQGRKVENPKKGLYIVNGKKTVVK